MSKHTQEGSPMWAKVVVWGFFIVILCCIAHPINEWPKMFWDLFAGGVLIVEIGAVAAWAINKMG